MPGKALAKQKPGKIVKKNSPSLSSRRLSKKHVHAATLEAQGKLTRKELCKVVGITGSQLERMRLSKIYKEELERQLTIFRHYVDGSLLGQKAKRIRRAEEDYEALLKIREYRAKQALKDPQLAAAGGETGLVLRKPIKLRGEKKEYLYEVDHETLNQQQAIRKEVGVELGEIGSGSQTQVTQVVVNFTKEEEGWL